MNQEQSFAAILLCWCCSQCAVAETNGYATISRRNAFALAQPTLASNPPPPVTAVQIKLTGVAVIPPQKWALLQIQAPGKKARAVTLAEGARDASLEVLEIDPRGWRVKIRNSGAVTLLTMASGRPESGDGPIAVAATDHDHVPLPTVPLPEAGER